MFFGVEPGKISYIFLEIHPFLLENYGDSLEDTLNLLGKYFKPMCIVFRDHQHPEILRKMKLPYWKCFEKNVEWEDILNEFKVLDKTIFTVFGKGRLKRSNMN